MIEKKVHLDYQPGLIFECNENLYVVIKVNQYRYTFSYLKELETIPHINFASSDFDLTDQLLSSIFVGEL